jgi:glyceraldehyde 3-phosphate dehydrogenase
MKPLRVGINGLGRIGRTLLRLAVARDTHERAGAGATSLFEASGITRAGRPIEVVAANDLLATDLLAYLLRYDTVHGRARSTVRVEGDELQFGPFRIRRFAERDPGAIPWDELGVEVVFECTGAFHRRAELERHLVRAPRVVLGQPGEADAMVVLGVNDEALAAPGLRIVSAASCTTHAAAPVLHVLERAFGVRWALLGTVHAYTAGQGLIDGAVKGSDVRRGRAASENIVPTTTHATGALMTVLPNLAGKLAGSSIRVPVSDGSMWDLTVTLGGNPTLAQVVEALRDAADGPRLRGILQVTDEPLVSSDVVGDPHSSIVDVGASLSAGPLIRLQGWYDNETGYAARLLDLAATWATHWPTP